MKKYTTFDEIENVLASLDLLTTIAPLVKRRNGRSLWKWMIVAAHDAIQGAIVCAIADTTGTSVLRKKEAKAMLAWLEDTNKPHPGEFLADFNTLLERAAITMAAQDSKDIKKLHDLRNNFAHFTPKTWALQTAGLPRIVGAALRIVERLMTSDRPAYRISGNRKKRLARNLDVIRNGLGL
jgi:hypothetical protein